MNDEGYMFITGRIKDLIIRGGENVSPKEIEDYLLTMPNVENVQVVGVHDEVFGEEIAALIKIKDLSKPLIKEDVLKFCKGKIAHFKVPKYVKFVDGFPITISGKPQKYIMRQELKDDFKDPKKIEEYKIR